MNAGYTYSQIKKPCQDRADKKNPGRGEPVRNRKDRKNKGAADKAKLNGTCEMGQEIGLKMKIPCDVSYD